MIPSSYIMIIIIIIIYFIIVSHIKYTLDKTIYMYTYTVDSRYLEFDGTMEKIRVNRSSTQEEL